MTKDITSIILKGTPRQRIILLTNEVGNRGFNRKSDLTEKEFNELVASFKTSEEIKLYNKFKRQEELVRNVITIMGQMQNAYAEKIAKIDGYCILWMEYERIETMLNEILRIVKSKTARDKILELISDEDFYLFSEMAIDKKNNNYIKLVTDYHYGLEDILKELKLQAEEILTQYKTVLQAVRDSIEETKFNVKAYTKYIDKSEKTVKNIEPVFRKFDRTATIKLFKGIKKENNIDEEFSKYWVYPVYDEIKISENLYNEYRKYLI